MLPNRLAVVIVGAGCIAAAGVGGFIAARPSQTGNAAPAVAAAPLPAVTTAEVPLPTRPVAGTDPALPILPSTPARLEIQATVTPPALVAQPVGTPAPAVVAEPRQTRRTDEAAAAERTAPAPAASIAAAPVAIAEPPAPAPPVEESRTIEPAAQEPAAHAQPSARPAQELVVQADSVIGLETETALSSERARVEDRVDARVVRDVRVNGAIAVPAGTRALGTVVAVERGGKLRERARLGIRFQTLLLADGTRLPISTETIYRYGEPAGDRNATKIVGGAAAGAILGAIINGGKGAAIGAAAGAGAGTAAAVATDRNVAVFPAGGEVTARILAPVTVTLDQ